MRSKLELLKILRLVIIQDDRRKMSSTGLCIAILHSHSFTSDEKNLLRDIVRDETRSIPERYDCMGDRCDGERGQFVWPMYDLEPRVRFLDKLIAREG